MKKIFSLLLNSFFIASAFAQLNTNLVLSATPPATLSEWGLRKEVLTYIITGQPGLAMQVVIKTQIKTTDGTVIGTTDLAKAKIYTLSSGTTLLYAVDVVPLENMIFTGKYKTSLQRSGKLPSDNYMLCVQLVRPADFTPVSAVQCKTFYLAATQLPILMKPYDGEKLDAANAQTVITFRWTPVVPHLQSSVTYRIQVFEVLDHQTPTQALRSNQPLLDQMLVNATQYFWRPQLSFEYSDTTNSTNPISLIKPKGKIFIWTIQSMDINGEPVTQTDGNGEGRSEPKTFIAIKKRIAL